MDTSAGGGSTGGNAAGVDAAGDVENIVDLEVAGRNLEIPP